MSETNTAIPVDGLFETPPVVQDAAITAAIRRRFETIERLREVLDAAEGGSMMIAEIDKCRAEADRMERSIGRAMELLAGMRAKHFADVEAATIISKVKTILSQRLTGAEA